MAEQQYVVQVSNSRGFPRFQVFKGVTATPVTNIVGDTAEWTPVSGGNPVSYQDTEPNGVSTFTLALSEP